MAHLLRSLQRISLKSARIYLPQRLTTQFSNPHSGGEKPAHKVKSTYETRRSRVPMGIAGLTLATAAVAVVKRDEETPDQLDQTAETRVIPFEVTREQAKKRLEAQFQGAFIAIPEEKRKKCEESLQAVYVPCWKIEVMAEAAYRGNVSVLSMDGGMKYRSLKEALPIQPYEILVYAPGPHPQLSVAIDTGLLDSVSSWDTTFGGDKDNTAVVLPFGMSAEAAWEKYGQEIVTKTCTDRARHSLALQSNAGEVEGFSCDVTTGVPHPNAVLLPVWIAVLEDTDGTKHTFIINGQTGKSSGELPLSIPTIALSASICVAAGITLLYALVAPPTPKH